MSFSVYAQKFSPETYDFGKEHKWNNPTATFTFYNNTSKPVLFLPVMKDVKLWVKLPEGYVEPGEKRKIEVRYYSREKGNFQIEVPVYLNTSPIPFILKLKGNILSFHPDALMECPTIDKKDELVASGSTGFIIVKDKHSGDFVNGADIYLDNAKKSYLLEDAKSHIVPLSRLHTGLYTVIVSKDGYQPSERTIYVNAHSGEFLFELERTPAFTEKSLDKNDDKGSGDFVELQNEHEDEESSIERVRKIMNEKYKGKKIIERDVVVVKENPKDSAVFVNENELKPTEIFKPLPEEPDFTPEGTLNSRKYAYNNVVFLIDVSGSMNREDKLPLLQQSLHQMIKVLRPEDRVTIVTYASRVNVIAESVSGREKQILDSYIDSLQAKGNSFGAEGLKVAYGKAENAFIKGGNNHVILVSDGLFNSKSVKPSELVELAGTASIQNIKTTSIFFGSNEEARNFMRDLSKSGQGSFLEIRSEKDAQSALIQELMQYSIKSN